MGCLFQSPDKLDFCLQKPCFFSLVEQAPVFPSLSASSGGIPCWVHQFQSANSSFGEEEEQVK